MARIFDSFLEMIFLFGIGFLLKRAGYVNAEDGKRGINIAVNWFVPASLVVNVPHVPFHWDWFLLPLMSWLYAALTIPILAIIFRRLYPRDWHQMVVACVGQATTLVGYPVMQGFFGENGLEHCIAFDAANFFLAYPAQYAVALLLSPELVEPLLSGGSDCAKKKSVGTIILNILSLAPTIGFFIGAMFRCSGMYPEEVLPEFINAALAKSAASTATITLFALGIFFEPRLFLDRVHLTRTAVFLSMKLGSALLFGCIVSFALGYTMLADPLIITTGRVCLVMATPPVHIAYSTEFGYDVTFAAAAVQSSLFASFFFSFLIAWCAQA